MMDALALIIMFVAVLAAMTKHFVWAVVAVAVAVLVWKAGDQRRKQQRRARRALERAKKGANTFRPTTTAFPDDSQAWSADSGFGRDR
jgi:NhaP-type Na+/H+ or K+/H+ antiporter